MEASSNNSTWVELTNNNGSFDHQVVNNVDKGLKQKLISNFTKQQLEIYIHIISFFIISLFGIITNIINIVVYQKLGLRDSITVGFFALSLSDLLIVTMTMMTASCYAAKHLLPGSSIDFPSVHFVTSGTLRQMLYSISNLFTAFLTLERCFCVVYPFEVKLIFTRKRTVIILMGIVVFHVVSYVPFYATQSLRWMARISYNNTVQYRLRIYFSPDRKQVEPFNYIVMGIFIPTVSQVIVTVCIFILVDGLVKSSNFRKAQSGVVTINTSDANADDTEQTKGSKDTLSNRDSRLVKTMVILVIILSASNIPLLMITYAQRIIPDLDIGGAYQNTFSVCSSIVYILSTVSASVNIFAYYATSTRYREIFLALINCK